MDAAGSLTKPFLKIPLASPVIKQHHPFQRIQVFTPPGGQRRTFNQLQNKRHAIYKPLASITTYFQELINCFRSQLQQLCSCHRNKQNKTVFSVSLRRH